MDSSQHLKWFKTFHQSHTFILNNTRSCLRTTLMNFCDPLQMSLLILNCIQISTDPETTFLSSKHKPY